MKTSVELDKGGIIDKIETRTSRVQYLLDAKVLADSNYFCPQDTSALIDSSINANTLGQGYLEWNTPYARAQYYELPNKSTDKNPNARSKWFEAAKAEHKDDWLRMANAEYHK